MFPGAVWLSGLAFLLLSALTGYGLWHEHLFQQFLWQPEGLSRFFLFSAIYWPIALALPARWLGGAAAVFVLGYSMWWCGPAAPLAVLFLFGSAFLLGKRLSRASDAVTATLAGLSVILVCAWIALHFPVNRTWVYAAVLALPWLLEAGKLREHAASFRFSCSSRRESAALALLLFLLLAHGLVALKPEVSSDGLSMHLALPMTVAHQARWHFDIQQQTWAVMPAGADALYTAAYLLGGESAARLTNFGMLLLIVALVVSASRRWLTLPQALLTAALFASTPLVQLVAGSLFVENVWGALAFGAMLILIRSWESGDASEIPLAGLLLGAAISVKLIAAVFLLPAAVLGGMACWRQKKMRAFAVATLLIAALGAPAYLFAWAKTGNPIFPFANATFRSPYFDATASFSDSRYTAPVSWKSAYDATFRSGNYFEGRPGALGFQYLLFLVPALLTLRKRFPWLAVAAGASVLAVLFIALPNLRYMYPALPLLSIAIGNLLAEWPGFGTALVIAVTALNIWFWPASGWYHADFAFFSKQQAREYVEQSAPIRSLIDDLNRTAPGQPVALFTGDGIAGLNGRPYTNTWHNEAYWARVRNSRHSEEVAAYLKELGIHYMAAPVSFESPFPIVTAFLRQWAEPTGVTKGDVGLFLLRDKPQMMWDNMQPLGPGSWDDLDSRIEYEGRWIHDRQFPKSSGQSLTYSADPGDTMGLKFTGSRLTYIYTKAFNRGRAQVLIDGLEAGRLDMYSPEIQWQAQTSFDHLGSGTHRLEIRILDTKHPRSAGHAVDVDGIVVTE